MKIKIGDKVKLARPANDNMMRLLGATAYVIRATESYIQLTDPFTLGGIYTPEQFDLVNTRKMKENE